MMIAAAVVFVLWPPVAAVAETPCGGDTITLQSVMFFDDVDAGELADLEADQVPGPPYQMDAETSSGAFTIGTSTFTIGGAQ